MQLRAVLSFLCRANVLKNLKLSSGKSMRCTSFATGESSAIGLQLLAGLFWIFSWGITLPTFQFSGMITHLSEKLTILLKNFMTCFPMKRRCIGAILSGPSAVVFFWT